MFKKLKDKIAEEVKASPQRVTQLAKSVVGGGSPDDNANMFSIDEESAVSFNTSTPTPSYTRSRRDSNSSFASDVSFLPSYESPGNLYHLQSDLDVSASEVEDSGTSHADRAQVLGAYKNAMAKYNKYRGRYSDLASHYRLLERENAKTKSILVETQDKALRRVAELKEQCSLEQNAKAHMEQVLREDLNEKQILIDTLNTKIKLLQTPDTFTTGSPAQLTDLANLQSLKEQLEADLSAARAEHARELEALRHATRQKVIDLEGRMQDSRATLEEQLLEKEAELMQLRASMHSGAASSVQRDLQDKLSAVATLQAENKVLQSKNLTLGSLQERVTALAGVEMHNKALEDNITDLETTNTDLERQVADLTPLQVENKALRAQVRELTALEREYKQLQAKISDISILQAENNKLHAKLSELAAEDTKNASAYAALDAEHKKHIADLKSSERKTRELVAELSALKIVKNTFETESKELKLALNTRTLEMEELQLKCTAVQAENEAFSRASIKVEELNAEIQRLKDALAKKDADLKESAAQIEEMDRKTHELAVEQGKFEAFSQELEAVKHSLAQKCTEVQVLAEKTAKYDELEEEYRKQSQELAESRQEFTETCAELEKLRETLAIASQEVQDLTNKCAEMKESEEQAQMNAAEGEQSKYEKCQREVEVQQDRVNRLMEQYEELKHALDGKQEEECALHNELRDLQEKMAANEEEAEKHIACERDQVQQLNEQLVDKERTIQNTIDECARAKAEIEAKNVAQQKLIKELKEYACEMDQYDQLKTSYEENKKTMGELRGREEKLKQKYAVKLKELQKVSADLQRQVTHLEAEKTALQNDSEASQSSLETISAQCHKLRAELDENKQRMQEVSSGNDAITDLKSQLAENRRLQAAIEVENGELKQQIGQKTSKLAAEGEENERLRQEIKNMHVLHQDTRTKIAELDELRKKHQQDVERLESELQQKELDVVEADASKDGLTVEIGDLKRSLSDQEAIVSRLKSEQETSEVEKASLVSENTDLKSQNTELQLENTDLKTENTELISQTARLSVENENLTRENTQIHLEKTHLAEEMSSLTVENTRLQSTNSNQISPTSTAVESGPLRTQITNLEHALSQKQHDLTSLSIDRDSLITELNALEADTMKDSKTEAKLRAMLEEQLAELESRNTELLKLLDVSNAKLAAYESELSQLREAREGLIAGSLEKQREQTKHLVENAELQQGTLQLLSVDTVDVEQQEEEEVKTPVDNATVSVDNADSQRMEQELQRNEATISELQAELPRLTDTGGFSSAGQHDKAPCTPSNAELQHCQASSTRDSTELQDRATTTDDLEDKATCTHDKATATLQNNAPASPSNAQRLHNLEYELQRVAQERETSVQFYQNELARLRKKNTKLESQLDETLVTLNHCTELSEATTEMQYLRNILYNYMMGKESIVLARVIAAVCKFEPQQTDAVLAKEQQKQTLLGQLGIL